MAVVKFGAIVTDIKGKLGGHVFQGSKGGGTIRTGSMKGGGIIKDLFPPGSKKQERKASFLNASKIWQGMTPEEKESWNNLLGVWTFTNKFGETVNRSGYAIFTAAAVNNQLVGQVVFRTAPIEEAPFPLDAIINFDPASGDFNLVIQNAESVDQKYILEQALITSKNKQAPSSKYKIIKTGTADPNVPVNITNDLILPPSFNTQASEFAIFFRISTFKPLYPRKYNTSVIVKRLQ